MSINENSGTKWAGPLRRGCVRIVRALARCIIPCYGASSLRRRRRHEDSVGELRDGQVTAGKATAHGPRDYRALKDLTGDGPTTHGEAVPTVTTTAIAAERVVECPGRDDVRPQRINDDVVESVTRTRNICRSVPASGTRSRLTNALTPPVETTANRGRYAGASQVIQTEDRTVQMTRAVAPWPLTNLTTVHLLRQPIRRPDEAMARVAAAAAAGAGNPGGPITVTVSHGGALRTGHLNGWYADNGMAGLAYTQIVLAVRMPTKRPLLPADMRPAYRTTVAGRCDVATVTRPGRTTGAHCLVVDVPALVDARDQPVAAVRVSLTDGTLLGRASRRRRAGRDEFVCTVYGCYRGFVGRVDAVRYRQTLGPYITAVDLVVTGPAVFCVPEPLRRRRQSVVPSAL